MADGVLSSPREIVCSAILSFIHEAALSINTHLNDCCRHRPPPPPLLRSQYMFTHTIRWFRWYYCRRTAFSPIDIFILLPRSLPPSLIIFWMYLTTGYLSYQRKQSTFMASCVSEAKTNALGWDKFHIIYARRFIVWSRSHLFVPSSLLITSNTSRARSIIYMPLATWALKKGMRQY